MKQKYNKPLVRYPTLPRNGLDNPTWNQTIKALEINQSSNSDAIKAIYDELDTIASVLDYGADPTGVRDSTPAFLAALQDNMAVYIPWKEGYVNYRIKNLSLSGLNGRRLFSRASTTYENNKPLTPLIKKATGSATCVFDTDGVDSFTFEGFRIEGVDRSCPLIATGGDNITLRDMSLYGGKYGYGHDSTYGRTTQIFNCWFVDNKNGIRNIVDTTIVGGAIAANQEWGIYLATGASFNNITTRVEWNGYAVGSSGGPFTASGNIYMAGAIRSILNCTIDAGNNAGLSLDNVVGLTGNCVFRRNGRNNGASAGTTTHILQTGACAEINLNFVTETGKDDNNEGDTTPKYVLVVNRTGNNPRDVTYTGGWSGYTTQPTTILSGSDYNLRQVHLGSGAPPVYAQTGTLAHNGTVTINTYFKPNSNTFRRHVQKLKVTVRDTSSGTNHYYAEIPILVGREGSDNYLINGTPSNEIGTNGYISFDTSAKILLSFGTLSESGGFITAPLSITNKETADRVVFVEVE